MGVIAPHPPLRGTFSPRCGAKELDARALAPRQRGEGGRRSGEGSSYEARRLAAPALRDRHLPSAAEGLAGDADGRCSLPAFEFIRVDDEQDLFDERAIEAGGDDLVDLLPLLDVQPENSVEDFVWRERVLVSLIRPQLGRRRL